MEFIRHRMSLFLAFAWLAVGSACAGPTRVISKETGAAQAREDLAAGKVKVLEGGGIAIFAPGVPAKDPRFSKLPREHVPCGCTTPHAAEWFDYARGYNEVVVDFVVRKPAR